MEEDSQVYPGTSLSGSPTTTIGDQVDLRHGELSVELTEDHLLSRLRGNRLEQEGRRSL